MKKIFLSFGSNIGDRRNYIEDAFLRLSNHGKIINKSDIIETEPVDYTEQNKFLNCVAEFETEEAPEILLNSLKNIEKEMGRVKTIDKGPRIIDIDILLYGNIVLQSEILTIPHKSMINRKFFLELLLSLDSEIENPVNGKPFKEYLDEN
ncbi:MAG TPA: 2-amino-4-hydroxy-6-hydroxymethyldihydropteridine diphosphokinase [Spirochaetota bacterium]|nr:2-amino-4-hydroxy-6-hydroxymethyldihydropteridine diphosphokinase [Spirochaetota bacterium]HPM34701.1 2-amino-4-hydroxy-6-hydroxymethyldihydropteridine diphosphokinase [Spirochaetota bacterium]